MSAPYPMPSVNETAGIYDLVVYTSGATDGYLFVMILWIIFGVAFLALKAFSSARALLGASFLCSILGIMLAVLDLIAARHAYIMILFFAISIFWLKLENSTVP